MKHLVCAALVAAGCSKSPDADWSKKPLVAAEGSADGVDKGQRLAFTIQIPEGLPRDDRDGGDWSDARAEYDHVPKVFTFVQGDEPDLDSAMRWDVRDHKDKAVSFPRKEARPDGFAYTMIADDKHKVEAVTLKRLGKDRMLKCSAVQNTRGKELPSFDATRAMLEKICDSIQPKP